MIISDLMAHAVAEFPDREALCFPDVDVRLTFGEVEEQTRCLASHLLAAGVGRGTHVGIWSTNCPEWALLQLACARIGAVTVPINANAVGENLAYLVGNADVDVLFAMARFRDADTSSVLSVFDEGGGKGDVGGGSARFPRLRSIIRMPVGGPSPEWDRLSAGSVDAGVLSDAMAAVRPDDLYCIQYTSGTTGRAKGAMLTQAAVTSPLAGYTRRNDMRIEDRVLVPAPFFHVFGNVLTLLGGLFIGCCMIYPASFHSWNTVRILKAEQCTCVMGVPTMYVGMMENPGFGPEATAQVRLCGLGGSYCSSEFERSLAQAFGATVINGLGMSETSSVCTGVDVRDPVDERVGTLGRAIPGMEMAIARPGHGGRVGQGERGEVLLRGPGVMVGYYNDPESTALALDADGWLHTGDLGFLDEHGALHLVGRLKNIIIRGGENIIPSEVEGALELMPGVYQAVCVGVPDRRYGEEVAALVRLEEQAAAGAPVDAESVHSFLAGRLPHHMIPRYVWVVDEFPLGASGKVDRDALRRMAASLLSSPAPAVR